MMKQPKSLSQAHNMARLKYYTIFACKILSKVKSAPAENVNQTKVKSISENGSEHSKIDKDFDKILSHVRGCIS